jgi:hypothetical protein
MKRLFLFFAALFITATIFSCKEGDYEAKSLIVQDSLVNVLPTWQALKIKLGENNTNMRIVVGDATLYKASDDVKKQKAQEVAKLVLRIYGPGNYLEKGNLIITADVRNKSENPQDGINIPIDFAALKKAGK